MFGERKPIPKMPDNSKAGITIHLNQKNREEPFEITVFLKKPGKAGTEAPDGEAVSLAASGKLRLTVGETAFFEIFAENSREFAREKSVEEEEL